MDFEEEWVNNMNAVNRGCLFRILTGMCKFLFVYYVFGMIALPTIIGSLILMDYIETGSSEILFFMRTDGNNAIEFISLLIEGVTSAVPFDGLFELVVDQNEKIERSSMLLSGLFSFVKGLCDKEIIVPAWKIYAPELIRDVVIATVASLIFFVFSRLNKLLAIFNGFSAQLAFYIVSVLWYYASFCCAECIILIIEHQATPQSIHKTYFFIFLISFLLHALLLGFSVVKGSSRIPRALVILGIDALFSVIVAFALWGLKSTLYGLFNIFNGLSIIIFVFVALALRVLEDLKDIVLKRTTYTLFTVFGSIGKKF